MNLKGQVDDPVIGKIVWEDELFSNEMRKNL